MSLSPSKVLIIGPTQVVNHIKAVEHYFPTGQILLLVCQQSGKTSLANFLSDAKDVLSIGQYRPTVGCRILEFQLESSYSTRGANNRDIQLWDCSADRR